MARPAVTRLIPSFRPRRHAASSHAGGRGNARAWRARRRWLVPVLALSAAVVMVLAAGLVLPMPFANRFVAQVISTRLAAAMACAGATGPAPKVTLGGGPLLPQLLQSRFERVEVSVPDLTMGDLNHVAIHATLRDVQQKDAGVVHVGGVDASITTAFANLPAEQDGKPVKAGRGPDGSITLDTVSQGQGAKGTVLSKLELRGASLAAVPQKLKIFGRTISASQAADRIGGVRVQQLPPVPAGVSYDSISVQRDGLHVGLNGAVTRPLSELPAQVGGRKVTYKAVNGTLAISPQVQIPLIGDIPVTIFAAPELQGDKLTMNPRSVTVLGRNRPPEDPIAGTVLGQIDQAALTKKLPALPEGVRYKSAAVDSSGVQVRLGGVTVKPFSALPAKVDGRATTYAAQDGLLATTAVDNAPARVTLYVKPRITGSTLSMEPQQIRMFGVLFPAGDVFAEIKPPNTSRPLQALPPHLAYRDAEVVPEGLRIAIGGADVELNTNRPAASCHSGGK